MPRKPKIIKPTPDPTLPTVEIELGGKTYTLCANFRAFATLKAEMREAGLEVNIFRLMDLGNVDVDTLPILFAAYARQFHRDLTVKDAAELIDITNYQAVFAAIAKAYVTAMSKPEEKGKANPTTPS